MLRFNLRSASLIKEVAKFFTITSSRDLISRSFFALVIRSLAAVLSFFVTLLVARQLGVEQSGSYFLAFAIISILSAFARMGLDNTTVRFIGRAEGEARSVFNKAMLAVFVSSFFVFLFLYGSSDFIAVYILKKPEFASVLNAISLAVVGVSTFTLAANALQGLGYGLASISILNIFPNLLLLAGVLFFQIQSAIKLSFLYSLSSVLVFVCGCIFFLFKCPVSTCRISWAELWKSCAPLWVVMIMSQTIQWSGQFVSGVFISSEEVARLAVAQRIAMLVSIVLVAINTIFSPRLSHAYSCNDLLLFKEYAITSAKLSLLSAVPVIGFMLIFPSTIMAMFGEGFSSGFYLLQIFAVGQFFNAITGSVGYVLMMSGHEKDMRNVTIFSGVSSLVLVAFLSSSYGAFGGAVGAAFSLLIQNVLSVYYVKVRLGFNILFFGK